MEGPINVSFSTLAAMSLDGMIGWKTTAYHGGQGDIHGRRGQDTGCFLENFCSCVLPYLRPFPEPCSVVVLDNSTCARTALELSRRCHLMNADCPPPPLAPQVASR
jgi:hypothetical protein